jgi:uncharacterized protein YbjT (DUF2867 family)
VRSFVILAADYEPRSSLAARSAKRDRSRYTDAHDHFFNGFAVMARRSPVLPLIGGGTTKFQPVSVADVTAALVQLLNRPDTAGNLRIRWPGGLQLQGAPGPHTGDIGSAMPPAADSLRGRGDLRGAN